MGPTLRVSPRRPQSNFGSELEVGADLDVSRQTLTGGSAERRAIEIRVDAVQVHPVESVVELEAQLQSETLRDPGSFCQVEVGLRVPGIAEPEGLLVALRSHGRDAEVGGFENSVQVVLAAGRRVIADDVRIIQVIAIRVVIAAIGGQADDL